MTRERATRFRFDPSEEEIADLLKCSAVLQRKTHQVGEGSATRDAHAASTMPWNGISQGGKAGLQNPSNPVGDTNDLAPLNGSTLYVRVGPKGGLYATSASYRRTDPRQIA